MSQVDTNPFGPRKAKYWTISLIVLYTTFLSFFSINELIDIFLSLLCDKLCITLSLSEYNLITVPIGDIIVSFPSIDFGSKGPDRNPV